MHERALGHVGPLPEMRVDLPPGAGVEAAWVTVAALEPDRELVITELRPGRRSDRRRRSEPHWMEGPRLRIFALGRTRLMTAESRLDGRWLDNRAGQILKFLVAERHRIAYDVDVHRALLVLLLREGRRSEALRRYEALRRRRLVTFREQLDFSLAELLPTAS